MEAQTITIHWHDEYQPVYLVAFQPTPHHQRLPRLATAGGDNNVRMWRPVYRDGAMRLVEYLATLAKHTQAVNVVRFDARGDTVATAGDDGSVLVWTLSDTLVREFGAEDDAAVELWVLRLALRLPQAEIYDVAWLPCGQYILAGSMDNVVRIYSAQLGHMVCQMADHAHYVQGVAWDPRGEYVATQSADRSVHVYTLRHSASGTTALPLATALHARSSRADLPVPLPPALHVAPAMVPLPAPPLPMNPPALPMNPPLHRRKPLDLLSPLLRPISVARPRSVLPLPAVRLLGPPASVRSTLLYHNETLQLFFRRLAFLPDGSLLLTPSGVYQDGAAPSGSEPEHTVYIYTRAGLNRPPAARIPALRKPALAVLFSPVLYALRPNVLLAFALPYRMVFAVATVDTLFIFDTQQAEPLALIGSLHYLTLTDLAWSLAGDTLVVGSTDGFCLAVLVQPDVLGEVYDGPLLVSTPLLLRSCLQTRDGERGRLAVQKETVSSTKPVPGDMPPPLTPRTLLLHVETSGAGRTSLSETRKTVSPPPATPSSSEGLPQPKKRRIAPTPVAKE